MRRRFLVAAAAALLPAFAASVSGGCGSAVTAEPPGEGGGGAGGVDHPFAAVSSTSAGTGGARDAGARDAFDAYVDPGCPDAGQPIESFACDPYAPGGGGCAPGEGCYIYVAYPSEPCGQEEYGSVCAPAGFGQQGDPCASPLDCGSGLVCVITGSGTQCVELCKLQGEDGCPPGLVCEPIDVQGFGGCL